MKTLVKSFAEKIVDALQDSGQEHGRIQHNTITEPPKPDMGDLAFPCFSLAKELRKSPALIAQELAAAFVCDDLFIEAKAIGPYLNVTIDGSRIAVEVIDAIHESRELYGSNLVGASKGCDVDKVVVDYSSPNIAKHLGVHHLRSTMIGNAICNLHEKCGYEVARINYLGDWGTQFGKLLAALSESNYSLNDLSIDTIASIYVNFTKRAEARPELNDEARAWFKKLEDGDETATNIWETLKATSLKEFEDIYQRLGVSFTQFDGESNYSQAALDVVQECLDKGIAIEGDGGAIVVKMGEGEVPCMLRKSDGATTYLARDVGAVITRYKEHSFEKMLYVVGQAQALHFKQVFFVLGKMGHNFNKKCHHIPFGLLKFQGSKFSSRGGNMLLLNDVLDTAADEVAAIAKEKGNEIGADAIDQIGIGAVVFADLSRKRTNDANFKWDEILNFDGNTGPYLQYTVARTGSILDKSAQDSAEDMRLYEEAAYVAGLKRLVEPEEKRVLLKLAQFEDVIIRATTQCEPAVMAQYAMQLAKLTNKFIHACRVVQKDKTLQVAREGLLDCVQVVLYESLRILGIESLEKM
jgi:arginyl-tRNA synthetase